MYQQEIPNAKLVKEILETIIKILEEKDVAWPHEIESLKGKLNNIQEYRVFNI